MTCGCCGGGYTIVAKDRYGCYRRKTQGKQECGNSRTITRDKLEARVLARLRRGLMTESFARQFAAEVERLMAQSPDDATAARAELEARLRKTETAIDRLLDRLEGDEAGDSLMERLKTREAERDAMLRQLAETAESKPIVLPTQAELEAIYRAQVERLEAAADGLGPHGAGQRAPEGASGRGAGLGRCGGPGRGCDRDPGRGVPGLPTARGATKKRPMGRFSVCDADFGGCGSRI